MTDLRIDCARRAFLLSAGALAAAAAGRARAADFPVRPVTLVVPYAAGGPTDVVARLIAEQLTELWKQRVIVENKPGASGTIGAQAVMQAPADGHVLLLHATSGLTIYPALAARPVYDTLRDFTPIAPTTYSDLVLVVNPANPARDVRQLVAAAKAAPGTVSYASAGIGGLNHIGGALLAMLTQTQLTHIPYKGDSPAVADLVAGNVTMSFLSANLAIPQVRAGKLRGLAVSGRSRSAALPELPTMIEAGVPDFNLRAWNAVLGPAGLPPDRVAAIHAAISGVMKADAVRGKLADMGLSVDDASPRALAERIAGETERWRAVIKAANITPE